MPGSALSPGEGALVPIWQEAGWALEVVWMQRLEEKFFASAGDWTPVTRSSVCSQTLYWLSYPRSVRLEFTWRSSSWGTSRHMFRCGRRRFCPSNYRIKVTLSKIRWTAGHKPWLIILSRNTSSKATRESYTMGSCWILTLYGQSLRSFVSKAADNVEILVSCVRNLSDFYSVF
jgi:hypothetical protein